MDPFKEVASTSLRRLNVVKPKAAHNCTQYIAKQTFCFHEAQVTLLGLALFLLVLRAAGRLTALAKV
jgi:hypothetical protein